ncbi:MAG: DUF4382 domain-containing protein [Woeseiaceae bacterium]|nr:DUF4382 domain-containing protein [Woeseiaceae bacterium]
MNHSNVRAALAVLSAGMLIAAGCSGSGSGAKTGRINLGVSDHPIHDATKVCIAFTGVEIKPKEGPAIMATPVMDEVSNINLLDFQGMNAAPLLMNYELPAGEVSWIRLAVNAVRGGIGGTGDDPTTTECQGDESYIAMESTTHNLYIPSGAQSGLKLHGNIVVPQGGLADFTVEFDLMKSVASPPGLDPDAVFRPTLRLVNNAEVGALTGQVSNELVVAECAPSVYLFEDDGMDAALVAANALTSAMVEEQMNELEMTEYHYTIGFLLGGDYEIAFSCDDGVTLDPANGKPATVVAGEVTEVDLP